MTDPDILTQLDAVLARRRQADAHGSYTASLYAGGTAAITDKVAEESAEVIEAAQDMPAAGDDPAARAHLVHEVADLWFHCMVLLQANGADTVAVQAELAQRMGISGFEEKAARTSS